MFLVVLPVMTTGGTFTLTGILMGVGLLMSAVSTFKLLVNVGGNAKDRSDKRAHQSKNNQEMTSNMNAKQK